MSDVGILGIGAYAPDQRITAEEFAAAVDTYEASGINEKAVPAPDEDAVTMAYEAGSRALEAADIEPDEIGSLSMATTNPPLEEDDLLAHLGAMFGIGETVARELHSGSTVAGLRALRSTFRDSHDEKPSLVVASDAPLGEPNSPVEHAAGAAAVAFIVGSGGQGLVSQWTSSSIPASGVRFRRPDSEATEGLGITGFDRNVLQETTADAVSQLTRDIDEVDAVVIQALDGTTPYRVAKTIGMDTDLVRPYATVHELGDTGTANVPLGIARAIAEDAERVLAVGYGAGSSSIAAIVELIDSIPVISDTAGDVTLTHSEYVRRRGFLASGPPEGGGGYVSLPALHRSLPQRYRLECGRCPECTSLNFPPTGACSHCHESVSYEVVNLSKNGTLEAVSVISAGGAPPEFAELQERAGPYATGIVAFNAPAGGSVSIPAFIVEPEGDFVSVGANVKMTIRRLYTQEGVPRYGFKVLPTDST